MSPILLSAKSKAPISKHLCRLQIQGPCHPLGWQGVRFGHGTAITCSRPGTDLCFAGNSSEAMPYHKTAGFKKQKQKQKNRCFSKKKKQKQLEFDQKCFWGQNTWMISVGFHTSLLQSALPRLNLLFNLSSSVLFCNTNMFIMGHSNFMLFH